MIKYFITKKRKMDIHLAWAMYNQSGRWNFQLVGLGMKRVFLISNFLN